MSKNQLRKQSGKSITATARMANYFYDLPTELQEIIFEKKNLLEFKEKYKNAMCLTLKKGSVFDRISIMKSNSTIHIYF